ncbi:hypothetical protein Acr_13g0002870 [Actinidia rufa]|uniref:Uncharacterized protein n=1 Tax=Actinidia rufa TaxID=165716 RepID=A0A7J0FKB4_9ERIC|nr:hypothetical protein Acr_13g0002870 [Actinidia rufa]
MSAEMKSYLLCNRVRVSAEDLPVNAKPDLSLMSIGASNTEKSVEMKNYLLCNRVRVFTCIPDIVFPKGTVLLPIDDCKWLL